MRLTRAAHDQRSTLLVASPYRVSGTAAHSVVQLRPRRASWNGRGAEPRLLDHLNSSLELAKGPEAHAATRHPLVIGVAQPVARPITRPQATTPKAQPAPRKMVGAKPQRLDQRPRAATRRAIA